MEENSEKNIQEEEDFEDFKDFDAEESVLPEVEAEEISEEIEEETPQESDIPPFDENLPEHEEDLLKEAELIAQMTKEANFGTPAYFNGTSEKPDEEITEEPTEANEEETAEDIEEPIEQEEPVEEIAEEEIEEPSKEEPVEEITEKTTEEPAEVVEEKQLEKSTDENIKETTNINNEIKFEQPKPAQPLSQFEELEDDDGVFKKYIFYVSKDFVSLIDSLTIDERTAYINDAIQRKVDAEYENSIIYRKKKILSHVITMLVTFLIVTPILLFMVHKSIMLTFRSYKYSQDNFEKLYKERFKEDRAYMRMLNYNKEHFEDNNKEKKDKK